ncbi:hypothetical protein BGY98DRAFT_1171543 [Russula aff. rugulosa BPL654]|nr:hypothetical protein BGY98DRAFT_1171543 [Russula aff. rugulosa BPL654]
MLYEYLSTADSRIRAYYHNGVDGGHQNVNNRILTVQYKSAPPSHRVRFHFVCATAPNVTSITRSIAIPSMDQVLTPLRESIIDKLPLASLSISPTPAATSCSNSLRPASPPLSVSTMKTRLITSTSRKDGSGPFLDAACTVVPEQTDLVKVYGVELHKLNVYAKRCLDSSYPLSNPLEGFNHPPSRPRAFDSAAALSATPPPSIGHAAFFSDVRHGVTPTASDHRVTLTYNLYFNDDDERGPAPAGD